MRLPAIASGRLVVGLRWSFAPGRYRPLRRCRLVPLVSVGTLAGAHPSPSDSAPEIRAKVHEYLEAGVSTVWLVYAELREADIWNRGGSSHMGVKILTADCLPGLAIPVESVLPMPPIAGAPH